MRKKQKEFIERSNADAGFSLIEMVVTVLITSILMLAVGLFMSSSNSIYQTVGTSSKLQEESLSASNFLNEILIESVNIAYSPDSSSTKYWVVKALDNDDSADKGEKDSTTGLWSTIDYDYYIFLLTKTSGQDRKHKGEPFVNGQRVPDRGDERACETSIDKDRNKKTIWQKLIRELLLPVPCLMQTGRYISDIWQVSMSLPTFMYVI